jgi:uncharacterized protein YwqG
MPSPDHLRARLAEAGLGAAAERIMALARPSIRLTANGQGDSGGIAASRLGGEPDLPSETPWPEYDEPLSFIAQVDLSECHLTTATRGLPPAGLLSFFYVADQSVWGFDPKDRGAWRVFFTPPNVGLRRIPVPESIPKEARYRPLGLRGVQELTYAPGESYEIGQLGLTPDDLSAYSDALFAHGDARFATSTARFGDVPEGEAIMHRLLGHPDPIQGDMQLECQLTSHGLYTGNPTGYADPRVADLRSGAADWHLLFQVDSEDAAGMMWGDVSRLYYWIRDSDLGASNFDNCWMVLQCC